MHSRPYVAVIEDNRDNADTLSTVLQLSGYEVAVAYNGPDGLKLVESTQPVAVICDIGLPGMDGLTLAKAIRQRFESSAMTLIALTGYNQDDFRRLGREAGFDHHFVKPAALDLLLACLPKPNGANFRQDLSKNHPAVSTR
jgi:CheY-like chemotaxis protein